MASEEYEPVPAKAIDELIKQLRPAIEAAGSDLRLEEVLAQPAATQLIAKWGSKHGVDVLRHRGRIASWLLGALMRRGIGESESP